MQNYFYDLRYQVDKNEWRARAKRALVFQFCRKYLPKNKNPYKILDFGCGTGVLQEEFEEKFDVESYGLDTSKKAIEYCHKRGLKHARVFDGSKIPFNKETFDLVTAIDVIEHIDDDLKALVDIKRVIKKKGLAIILVPAHMRLWSTRDIKLHHFRRYEVGELEKKCRKVGFKLLTSKNVDFGVFFLFSIIHLLASKEKGVTKLGMDTASTNKILNEILFIYEQMENKLQNYYTFPVGLSIAVVVQKV